MIFPSLFGNLLGEKCQPLRSVAAARCFGAGLSTLPIVYLLSFTHATDCLEATQSHRVAAGRKIILEVDGHTAMCPQLYHEEHVNSQNSKYKAKVKCRAATHFHCCLVCGRFQKFTQLRKASNSYICTDFCVWLEPNDD